MIHINRSKRFDRGGAVKNYRRKNLPMRKLDDNEDVQNLYANFAVSDALEQKMSA